MPARKKTAKKATGKAAPRRKAIRPNATPAAASPDEAEKEGAKKAETYQIILRTPGAPDLDAKAQDRVLYPLTVAWNRVLEAHEARKPGWDVASHKAFADFAAKGELDAGLIDPFIEAAAKSGVVEVEMEWKSEGIGWAGRLFPWEALLAMATKPARERLQQPAFAVVRVLRLAADAYPSQKEKARASRKRTYAYAACDAGPPNHLNFAAELDALESSLGKVLELNARSLEQLEDDIQKKVPTVVHFAGNDLGSGPLMPGGKGQKPTAQPYEAVARATASHGPELAVYSCCYSGRRMAPHAIVLGAQMAVGFQGDVYDDSMPLFFGPFYLEWHKSRDIVAALRAGLCAHNSQRDADDLGGVVVWCTTSVLQRPALARAQALAPAQPRAVEADMNRKIPQKDLAGTFRVDFIPHAAFNYSVLHNERSGLFQTFTLTKKTAGVVPVVNVRVSLQTGVGTSESNFSFLPEAKAYAFTDMAQMLSLPLGAPLIRQRGEALWATLETKVMCDGVPLHEDTRPLSILPCDEWRDDEVGQQFLPSFVFPRNPAIRDVISAAQPFLRVLVDTPQAGFDGYQAAFAGRRVGREVTVAYQVRALWAALQHPFRLDYVNSAATHTRQSQRLRTPDEVLRSRRGTCIELALLLASCLEHVGIYPVLFLVPGHAFVGYWTSHDAHANFTKEAAHILKQARPDQADDIDRHKEETGRDDKGRAKPRVVSWRYNAQHHPTVILAEIDAGSLVAIEATCIPFQNSFQDATERAREHLRKAAYDANPLSQFDAMLDVRLARKCNVTPLPILVDGIFA